MNGTLGETLFTTLGDSRFDLSVYEDGTICLHAGSITNCMMSVHMRPAEFRQFATQVSEALHALDEHAVKQAGVVRIGEAA